MNSALSVPNNSVEALLSQLADEYVQRLERGEEPQIEEYADRYPQLAVLLRQVLPALQVLRQPRAAEADVSGSIAPEAPLGDFRGYRARWAAFLGRPCASGRPRKAPSSALPGSASSRPATNFENPCYGLVSCPVCLR
jgi:hypothetical protein